MSAQAEQVAELVVEPRTPRTDRRVDVYLTLLATLGACAIDLIAIFTRFLPPPGLAVFFSTLPPLAALLALAVLLHRTTGGVDDAVRWYCSGLGVAVAGMVVNALGYSQLSTDGGPFHTSLSSRGGIYFTQHSLVALGAIAAALKCPPRWRRPFVAIGALVIAAFTLDLVPPGQLLHPDGTYTSLSLTLQYATAALMFAATLLWIWRVGRETTSLRAWIAVALTLASFSLVFNALGGAQFTAVWWASLTIRGATYVVLLAGLLGSLLAALRRSESYSDAELGRREEQLERALVVTRQLLSATADLSRALTLRDVLRVIRDSGGGSFPGHRVEAVLVDDVAGEDLDPDTRSLAGVIRRNPLTAGSDEAVFVHGAERVDELLGTDSAPAGIQSLAVVPMVAADQHCGHLVVWSTQWHPWTPLDRNLITGLAYQAALSIVRAQAFEGEAEAAQTLQRSLLPPALPNVPGLRLGATYRPGERGTNVGGDWYDCIVVRDGLVALVIGDVMGKGLRAAAVMGQVRTAVRAAAATDPAPASVLRVLDEVALDMGNDEIVTLGYVLLDLPAGTATIARAGHLPPVVMDPQGRATTPYDGGSTPLGVPNPHRVEAVLPFPAGSTIVVFTDGAVEIRGETISIGLDQFVRRVTELGAGLRESPQDTIGALLPDGGGEDDLAVLVASRD